MSLPFPGDLRKVVLQLLEDLEHPRALSVAILIRHDEWVQLVSLRAKPEDYNCPYDYRKAAIATELLRKCADLPTGIDTQAEALAGFHAAEQQCALTNARLNRYIHNGPYKPSDITIHEMFLESKRWLGSVLGHLPDDLDARFGPGSTLKDVGRKVTIPDKMTSRPTVTKGAEALLTLWSTTYWCRSLILDHPDRSDPERVRGNRFTTVPKDATKDRGIAIEPSINIYYQLGVGGYFRRALEKIGIDLEEGQTIHRQVAREASQSGRFSTIDLSSASDTVSRSLVKLLVPDNWHSLLDSLRSPTTVVGGKTVYLNKFSSMGNGFTFELETLIFLALVRIAMNRAGVDCVPGTNCWVYGDDIIVPTEVVKYLLPLFDFCGLTINTRKTFTEGPFRESCGGDFFDGVDVRPHYIKEYPNDPQTWITLANGIRRMAVANSHCGDLDYMFQRAWFRTLDHIPSNIRRLRGPSQLGDIVIHDREDHWTYRVRNSIRYFQCWKPVSKGLPLSKWSPLTQLASALYGVPSSGPIPRARVSGYRIGRVAFS